MADSEFPVPEEKLAKNLAKLCATLKRNHTALDSLDVDRKRAGVWIHIRSAEGLPIADTLARSSDPYVSIAHTRPGLPGSTAFLGQTCCHKKTLAPVWDQMFFVPDQSEVLSLSLDDSINFRIYDYDFGPCNNDYLCAAVLSLQNIHSRRTSTEWVLPLYGADNKASGTITVDCTYTGTIFKKRDQAKQAEKEQEFKKHAEEEKQKQQEERRKEEEKRRKAEEIAEKFAKNKESKRTTPQQDQELLTMAGNIVSHFSHHPQYEYDTSEIGLWVKVKSAENCAAGDTFGSSDPFVSILVARKDVAVRHSLVGQTFVVDQTLQPTWFQTFFIPDVGEHISLSVYDDIVFILYDKNQFGSPDLLGVVRLSLSEIEARGKNEEDDNEWILDVEVPDRFGRTPTTLTLELLYTGMAFELQRAIDLAN